MRSKIIVGIIVLVMFGIGFFAGMEFKAYQIRSAFENAFAGNTNSDSVTDQNTATPTGNATAMQQAAAENMVVIDKKIGEEIELATLKLTVKDVEERNSINSSYGSPKVAKEGTTFVVVTLDVTNTTKNQFSLSPDFLLIDNQEREFDTYNESIGAIDNYLNYRQLSPSVKESGVLVYEVPTDAENYSLVMAKAGTKELYKIALK